MNVYDVDDVEGIDWSDCGPLAGSRETQRAELCAAMQRFLESGGEVKQLDNAATPPLQKRLRAKSTHRKDKFYE